MVLKTVGLAVSDRTGFLASNYGVIRYSDTKVKSLKN